MTVLALETASDACSCALVGEGVSLHLHEVIPRGHAERVLDMVRTLLETAGVGLEDLEAIAFGRGPGSFTGVRIATAVAQGLAFGARRPVVPVSTLWALARRVHQLEPGPPGRTGVLAAFDARMGEVYWGAFTASPNAGSALLLPAGEECVSAPAAVPLPPPGKWAAAGSGWSVHGDALAGALGEDAPEAVLDDALPHAGDVAAIAGYLLARGGGVTAGDAAPVYLRNRVAEPPRRR